MEVTAYIPIEYLKGKAITYPNNIIAIFDVDWVEIQLNDVWWFHCYYPFTVCVEWIIRWIIWRSQRTARFSIKFIGVVTACNKKMMMTQKTKKQRWWWWFIMIYRILLFKCLINKTTNCDICLNMNINIKLYHYQYYNITILL